ncbi:phenylalanine--tRNA ligase beta subunit-like [Rhopalosiphum maidis]|uniref:phenylalanine--tRNA ligase beta subunit-like n=1 Tax=Rhopalosiphum maidis TaxID=43146 RepID=UPI000F0007B1|nr:phenylalanine--tRNA ligase beta subunit-like [Rhopalosiphum maidis]XP_026809321.1 phenylalanine--tRNA ligase beta subunit-like [Rhopalosiphum maidis]XP_026809466.1 phenylalanine--tRNA ligase beta subunit-like [Rhopalosiphum maidis]XP_026809467.1 phenylalanine--tRNA ligase beta subunit-like [Rhopalosiphum maidis]
MPTVNIKRDLLFEALGTTYTDEEFDNLCISYGLELDEVTSEKQMVSKEQSESKSEGASDDTIYRIDIPANRYDLLCLEGLVDALLVFQNKMELPRYKVIQSKKPLKVLVKPNTKQIRPYVVAAVLRDVTFNPARYASFIDLQDKLHQNICRKRSLVAIGTHDLDTIQGPFTYDALPPEDIKFKALNQTEVHSAAKLMDIYSTHAQLKQYLSIIKDSSVYPVITDSSGIVLSMPPIINGHHSRITLETKNVFIECTATDLKKANIVLDTVLCMFSKYCLNKYTAERCEVVYPDGLVKLYPELKYRKETVNRKKVNSYLGISENLDSLSSALSSMCLKSNVLKESDMVVVEVPPTRHDIIHACDLYEDVAIAYGYNNIPKTLPKTTTVGSQLPINNLSDKIRNEIAYCGFNEVLTFSLCSKDDVSTKLRKPFDTQRTVCISNPKTLEFQVARTNILSGLLKTTSANKKMPLPMKLFEVTDVVFKDVTSEVGARNERHICAIYYGKTPGFEIVHGLMDRIMQMLNIKFSAESGNTYQIKAANDETYFPGRCAQIIYKENVIGLMGVLHPEVITAYELTMPCSAFEINLEPFL